LTVDRPLGGGDWRRRRRGVDGLLGGGRFVDRSSRGGLGVHRLGWSYGDRGRGWRGRDVDRVRVGLILLLAGRLRICWLGSSVAVSNLWLWWRHRLDGLHRLDDLHIRDGIDGSIAGLWWIVSAGFRVIKRLLGLSVRWLWWRRGFPIDLLLRWRRGRRLRPLVGLLWRLLWLVAGSGLVRWLSFGWS